MCRLNIMMSNFMKICCLSPKPGWRAETGEISDLLVNMGPYVGQFVAKLFNVSEQHQAQSVKIKDEIDTILTIKMKCRKTGRCFKARTPVTGLFLLSWIVLIVDWGRFCRSQPRRWFWHRVARVGQYWFIVQSLQTACQGKPAIWKCGWTSSALRAKLAAHELRQLNLATSLMRRMQLSLLWLNGCRARWSFIVKKITM